MNGARGNLSSRWGLRGTERGAVSLEATLLVSILVLVVAVATAGWRIWWAQQQLEAATAAAARAVVLTRGASDVGVIVSADLATAGLPCTNLQLGSELGALATPAGTSGVIRVSAACEVNLADLLVPGLPGSVRVQASSSEPVDTYRERP